MKAATGIGIGVAIVGILMSAMMDGTSPAAFINIPALLIITAGTAGATMASVGMDGMKRIPSLYKTVISAEPPDVKGRVDLLVSLAEQARREGLLALDAKVKEIDDEFTNMIQAERGYQANSSVISTADQMLQTLVQLRA